MRTVPLLLALLATLLPARAHASPVSARDGASAYEASSAAAPAVSDLEPAPGVTLRAFFPRVSVRIQASRAPVRTGSLHVYVDGTDVSARATFSRGELAYVPAERMRAGWHDVFVEGSDSENNAFSEAWVFRSQNPDIDEPLEDDGFAFVPVSRHGRFAHFFLISPFDGFALLQLCNIEIPLHRASAAPVFFVTVPATLASEFLGCTPGLAFTPFEAGIGTLTPIFFPLEIAGPGIFQGGGDRHRRHPLSSGGTTSAYPAYRTTTYPVYPATALPVYRTTTTAVPLQRVPVNGAPVRAAGPPAAHAGAAHAGTALPTVVIPNPYIPH